MTTKIKQIPIMFRHHIRSSLIPFKGSVITVAIMLMLGVTLFTMFTFFLKENGQKNMPDSFFGRATLGVMISNKIIDYFQSKTDDGTEKSSGSLSGTTFAVSQSKNVPKDHLDYIMSLANQTDMRRVAPEKADVVFSYDTENHAWEASSPKPHIALLVWGVMQNQSLQNKEKKTKDIRDVFAVVKTNYNKKISKTQSFHFIRRVLTYALIMAPFVFILGSTPSRVSWATESARSLSQFEPFSLCPMPIWMFFLSQSIVTALVTSIICLIVLCLGALFVDFAAPVVIFLVWIMTFFTALTLSILGVAQTMILHYKHSRVVGILIFGPVPPMFFLVFWANNMVNRAEAQIKEASDNLAKLPFVDWNVPEALQTMGILIPICLIITVMLCAFIEWRVGARRTALASV